MKRAALDRPARTIWAIRSKGQHQILLVVLQSMKKSLIHVLRPPLNPRYSFFQKCLSRTFTSLLLCSRASALCEEKYLTEPTWRGRLGLRRRESRHKPPC